jgi:hypothetical protein
MPLQDGAITSNSSQEVHQEVEQGAVGPNINMLYEMIQKTQTELAGNRQTCEENKDYR